MTVFLRGLSGDLVVTPTWSARLGSVVGCRLDPLIIPKLEGHPRNPFSYVFWLRSACTERSTHTCASFPADLAQASDGGGEVGGGSGEGFYPVLDTET